MRFAPDLKWGAGAMPPPTKPRKGRYEIAIGNYSHNRPPPGEHPQCMPQHVGCIARPMAQLVGTWGKSDEGGNDAANTKNCKTPVLGEWAQQGAQAGTPAQRKATRVASLLAPTTLGSNSLVGNGPSPPQIATAMARQLLGGQG